MQWLHKTRRAFNRQFGLHPREGKRVLALMVVLLGLSACFSVWQQFQSHRNQDAISESVLMGLPLSQPQDRLYKSRAYFPKRLPEALLDPNQWDSAQLVTAGFPRHFIKSALRYRTLIGGFRHKEDVIGLYFLPDSVKKTWYQQLALPTKEVYYEALKAVRDSMRASYGYIPKSERPHPHFDLNTVDSAVLVEFPGIGPSMAKRILDFRTRLGGFASLNQLREVYGLDSSILCELRPYVLVNHPDGVIQKINVNTASEELLASHPYIGKSLARKIVRFRLQHGNFDQVESLRFVIGISDETLRRITPYLETRELVQPVPHTSEPRTLGRP